VKGLEELPLSLTKYAPIAPEARLIAFALAEAEGRERRKDEID
jgi:hypothetical protein